MKSLYNEPLPHTPPQYCVVDSEHDNAAPLQNPSTTPSLTASMHLPGSSHATTWQLPCDYPAAPQRLHPDLYQLQRSSCFLLLLLIQPLLSNFNVFSFINHDKSPGPTPGKVLGCHPLPLLPPLAGYMATNNYPWQGVWLPPPNPTPGRVHGRDPRRVFGSLGMARQV